jgi:hypothetical protein
MASKDDSVIRIGIGSRDGPKSGVWRIWAGKGKSDVYVAVRSYTGIFKVSLHETGECNVSMTSQFAERNRARWMAFAAASPGTATGQCVTCRLHAQAWLAAAL